MATAIAPFITLLAPLQALAGWLFPRAAPQPTLPPSHSAAQALRATSIARPARSVRVVRVFDGPRAGAGRLVIAGRMADVCAELDRLASQEAAAACAQLPGPTR